MNVLHNLEYKLIHHSVWRNSGSQLWSASGTSSEHDLYSVTGAVKSPVFFNPVFCRRGGEVDVCLSWGAEGKGDCCTPVV